ncbi:5'-methylthioadenosine/adenosylhomocysteine nucleosidase [Salinicoccus cyprini]|uniref:adenosylhomocysteine nucleosidase n=1 Tax=Salinicoccus cyprini TaxID=2493691 RepID=A0A558AYL7_9STAP|nr:5'-methylthioadenosine/adenosylhomocysteine nucleosidase [Salinicoccus cyprini]TVT29352.1 5'-methylthioadenosine/adenosylhomocysteine nucleosidase [Salinicoccus cyprini]
MTRGVIGIIGAMKPEIDILLEWMDVESTDSIAHAKVYQGKLEGQDVVLVQSGIGKVNASMITALLLERYYIRILINTGVAGALSDKLDATDMVVSTSVLHHDVDAVEFGYELGQVPGMPKFYIADKGLAKLSIEAIAGNADIKGYGGLIVSGDSFISSSEQKSRITRNFRSALAVDMESAAIAQTCYQYSTPFVIIRSISDKADDTADMTYEEFLSKACVHSSEVVKSLVKDL